MDIESVRKAQRTEITEYEIYSRLERSCGNKKNCKILNHMSSDEMKNYNFWKKYTKIDVKPFMPKVWFYQLLSLIFGLTFSVKLMEKKSKSTRKLFERVYDSLPAARKIKVAEEIHEKRVVSMIEEEKLKYIGSFVLGLSDSIVEMTGALAGLTLALQKGNLIGAVGLITGIAAALSMAVSEYQSRKSEEGSNSPLKSAMYTGSAYMLTVFILVAPFLLLENVYAALITALSSAVLIIAFFRYYISVSKDVPFFSRFVEMTSLSLGVAGLSFFLGFVVRIVFNVEV